MVVTLWESEEAMRSGEEASHWFRAFGAEVTNVERYEVVYSETEGNTASAGSRGIRSLGGR